MSVIALCPSAPPPAAVTAELAQLTDAQRDAAVRLEAQLMPAVLEIHNGASIRRAAEWLARTRQQELGCSTVTVQRYLSAYLQGGVMALAPQYKGRQRRVGGWEAKATEYARLPSSPCASTVARWLQDDGWDPADASETRVRRYIKSLPANAVQFAAARVGPHYHQQNLRPYIKRDRSVLPVGLIYQGDGHALHYYVQHPNTGRHFTAELTPWMDVASRYIAGWWLGEAESAVQTLYSLSHSLLAHNHVPAMLHVDPGSGFKNRAICDSVAGFAPRLGVRFMTALPGNAKGKGDIEGWFRWFEERHGKRQPSFKGPTVAQEFLRRLEKRIELRQMVIPAWDEALAGIAAYIIKYNETNQDNLGGRSPAALWEGLERCEVHVDAAVLVRPRETRTARRYAVQLWGRTYRAAALAAYEQREVQVEYDLHDADTVWLYDMAGRFLAPAALAEAKPWLAENRINDLRQSREDGRIKRLERRAEDMRAETRAPITADETLAGLEHLGAEAPRLESDSEAEGLPPLDLLDTDY